MGSVDFIEDPWAQILRMGQTDSVQLHPPFVFSVVLLVRDWLLAFVGPTAVHCERKKENQTTRTKLTSFVVSYT